MSPVHVAHFFSYNKGGEQEKFHRGHCTKTMLWNLTGLTERWTEQPQSSLKFQYMVVKMVKSENSVVAFSHTTSKLQLNYNTTIIENCLKTS